MAEASRRKKSGPPPKAAAEEQDVGRAAEAMLKRFGWIVPLASLIAAVTMGFTYGVGTGILTLAGGVMLGVIAILWASVRTLSGDAPITLEEAVALGAPTAAEEQKRAVLQALKDLEYERSVGKIADADYEEQLGRYRAEAKRLLRAVDEDLAPLRARAAAYVAERLGHEPKTSAPAPKATSSARACASCQTDNDPDALFCKKCGSKLDASVKDKRNATA